MNYKEISHYQSSLQELAGVNHSNFAALEKAFNITIKTEDSQLIFSGDQEKSDQAKRTLDLIDQVIVRYQRFDLKELHYLIDIVKQNKDAAYLDLGGDVIVRTFSNAPIRPKTLGQKHFIDTIRNHDLSFAIGPAGTGKTFLAVCYAVALLKEKKISKIILTRPAVEAGENLGFLPGDLKEKVDPYLRPLYDALDQLLSSEKTERYIEKGIIEIAPLAYMRGRTLDDAVIILDEAQNTSKSQMLMFLSRLGKNSKMIVTGDIQQIDLPMRQESGLKVAQRYLSHIDQIAFITLTQSDVVRHPLVIKILEEFEKGALADEANTRHRG
ncbi:MAG TPA: PhoH family protein [Erysipelothrix sp.]